jgi:[Skp1-protein]-hydroxyproline N-acetylglucosaminyltransferase
MDKSRIVLVSIVLLIGLWIYLFVSLFSEGVPSSVSKVITTRQISTPVKPPSSTKTDINTHLVKQPHSHSNAVTKEEPHTTKVVTTTHTRDTTIDLRKLTEKKLKPPPFYAFLDELTEPPPLSEIAANMSLYIHTLHEKFKVLAGPTVTAEAVWDAFTETTKEMPMKWDDENRHRFPRPRKDGSIYVSLGTYRDPFCPMTIKSLYANAKHPENVYVGLFQQNCFGPVCKTGVLVGGKVEDTSPDINCYDDFCASEEGKRSKACVRNQVRLFNVNESESLGPYMARYLGSKFYRGEQYYLQIDSHSEFVSHWDEKLIHMVETAEAEKPVISTYPPDSKMNWKDTIGYRMCDSEFASAQIEWQIVRLGTSLPFDKSVPTTPKYAPFVAAGFFFGPAELLYEVPFDPFLPWIFMGEEISVSARLWTSGYDIFSPTTNVLNHYYVRRHYPKFWESVNRFFHKPSIHNDIVELVINRVKYMLGYPESSLELVHPPSVLYRQQDWSMGKKRSLAKYMEMVGLDMQSKTTTKNMWCHKGEWPEIAKEYRVVKKKA